MTCRAAFASGFFGFLLRPSVGRPFFVSRPTAFAGDLPLSARLHRSEAASKFDHDASLDRQQEGTFTPQSPCAVANRSAVQLVCPYVKCPYVKEESWG